MEALKIQDSSGRHKSPTHHPQPIRPTTLTHGHRLCARARRPLCPSHLRFLSFRRILALSCTSCTASVSPSPSLALSPPSRIVVFSPSQTLGCPALTIFPFHHSDSLGSPLPSTTLISLQPRVLWHPWPRTTRVRTQCHDGGASTCIVFYDTRFLFSFCGKPVPDIEVHQQVTHRNNISVHTADGQRVARCTTSGFFWCGNPTCEYSSKNA